MKKIGLVPRNCRIFYPLLCGDKTLFIALQDGIFFVMYGNEKGKQYKGIESLKLADGKPLYVAKMQNQQFIVWGDKEGKRYNNIGNLIFSDGTSRFTQPRATESGLLSTAAKKSKNTNTSASSS